MHMGNLLRRMLFTVLAISMNTALAGLWKKYMPAETLPMTSSSKRNVFTIFGSSTEPMSRCKKLAAVRAKKSRSTSFFLVIGPVIGN